MQVTVLLRSWTKELFIKLYSQVKHLSEMEDGWVDTSLLNVKAMREACPKRVFFESANFMGLPDNNFMLIKGDKIVAGFFKKKQVMGYWEKVLND